MVLLSKQKKDKPMERYSCLSKRNKKQGYKKPAAGERVSGTKNN